jgi:hypothetical protein
MGILAVGAGAGALAYEHRHSIGRSIKMGLEYGPDIWNSLSDSGKQGLGIFAKTVVAGKVYEDMKPTIKAGLMVVIVGGGFFLFNGFGIFNPNYKASKPKVSAPKITKK